MNPLLLIAAGFQVLGCVGLSMVSLGALAGALNRKLDLLTHFTVVYLVLGLLGLATALFLPRRAKMVSLAACGVTLLSCGALMIPEYLAGLRDRALPAVADQLKLI